MTRPPEWKDLETQRQLQIIAEKEMIDATTMLRMMREREANPLQEIATPWHQHDGEYGLVIGGLHLLGGYSGHGKTTAALQICLQGMIDGHSVSIASMEMEPSQVMGILIRMAAANHNPAPAFADKLAARMDPLLSYWNVIDAQEPDDVLQWVYASAESKKAKLILLDNLMMVGDVTGEPKDEKEFCAALSTIAKQFQCAILLCHHFRKPGAHGENTPGGKEAFIGSSMMINICSSVTVIHKDVEIAEAKSSGLPVEPTHAEYSFGVVKNRYGEYHGRIPLWPHSSRLFCSRMNKRAQPAWQV
jgi:RecA-family ATPase